MKIGKLSENLRAVGKATETWSSPDGSRVMVLPYGGRVLGLFAPGDDENFFWTHASIENVDTAKAFYEGDQWHNSGGERTWLAPEVDFFFPNFPKLDAYFQQRELDPGAYQVTKSGNVLTWTNKASLVPSRTRQRIELEISKSLAPAVNPLRHDLALDSGIKFAGYTLKTSLKLTSAEQPPYIGLWALVQMPHGGDMMVPSFFRTEPKICMGAISPDDLLVNEHLVRYKMRAKGEHKLSIRALATTGRAGYLYSKDGQASLVVRNFFVDPSAEYVDVPWTEEQNFGFAFQACNVNSHLGAFSELEYHVPAIGSKVGKTVSEDESQLWAFRGPETKIKSIAKQILSAEA